MSKRIQRKRTKGWRMPEGAVYVGRPTRWGNPFSVKGADLRLAIARYIRWLDGHLYAGVDFPPSSQEIMDSLRGKDLACWCPLDQSCHADVLLEIANQEPAR